MRIASSIEPLTAETVTVDSFEFVRFSADNWYAWMGESLEPHFNCAEVETAYQIFKSTLT